MKRTQPSKSSNTSTDSDPDISQVRGPSPSTANPKRSRETENHGNSVSNSDVQKVQKSVPKSKSSGFQVDGENVVAESSSNVNTSKNENSYKFQQKRLQQPPAHINANLMKIKMEVDYVPIKTEPAQETEDDNNNGTGQVSSPSFSVESKKNSTSTSSAQNADEDNHEFGVLKSERGQEQQQQQQNSKQQQKIPTKPNDVTATVYATAQGFKFVINTNGNEVTPQLLSQIQAQVTSMKVFHGQTITFPIETPEKQQQEKQQKKQQQKKQQQEKHKQPTLEETVATALSSVIAQQLTEINQLKAQVAQQRKEIEELNTKLKLNAENQTPQTREWPTKVLSRIFGYLDLKSVKASRFVCRRWREEAGKVLLSNFYLVFGDKTKCENALINWIRNSYSTSQAKAGKLWSKDKNAQGTLQLLRKVKLLRSSITELIFAPVQPLTKNLHEILQLLPNLQLLETTTLDLSPEQKWLINDKILYNGALIKLELLVQKLETLKKLKLDFVLTDAVAKHLLHRHQQFEKIKSLEIRATGMNFINSFTKHDFYNWTITRFTLNVQENYNVGLIWCFFVSISPFIQHLRFIVNSSQKNSGSRLQPWTDDWIIPIQLDSVETLEIQEADDTEQFTLQSIVVALQLLRLKKLVVDYIPAELEQVINKWNSHESANGWALSSESLEELELSSWFASTLNSRKIPGDPWPRLKSLKCSCKFSDFFNASFLSQLRDLERLELNFSWEAAVGRNSKRKTGADGNRSSSEFQLRDLKYLKSLCLKFPNNEERCKNFANSLVQKDLKFMKSLQCVEFHRLVIDAEPLRSALGPNVPVIFTD